MSLRASVYGRAHWATRELFHAYFCSCLRSRAHADVGRLPQIPADDEPWVVLIVDHDGELNDCGDHGRDDHLDKHHDVNNHGFVLGAEARFLFFASVM